MNKLTIGFSVFLALVPSLLFAAAMPTTVPSPLPTSVPSPLSSYNWSTSASPSLAANPPPIDTVRTFITNLGSTEGMVCAIKFANFRNSGNLTLIAGHCASSDIDIVDLTSAGFQWNALDAALPDASDDVTSGVQDLLGNGTSELVVHAYLAYPQVYGYCTTVWPVVYAWSGGSYANVSTQPQYAPFYQSQLAALQAQLAASPSTCLQAEVDKIQRVLGNPAAGLGDATTWAVSANLGDQMLAAQILGDIGTSGALTVLQTLAGNSDPYMADVAQRFVENPTRNAPGFVTPQTIPNPGALVTSSFGALL
ncbi:MAG TPA: hypothetical protein VKS22_05020 [Candidatus Binataceae bacterium]|nr:hypothetical protein [Candidatus Binataceae bacterium]